MLDNKKYPTKKYLHFDHRIKIENAENYVTNPIKIAKHSFLPFIHYVASFDKNIGKANLELNNRPIKRKDRDIMYAGHWDNFIYKYYAEILNKKYNEFCVKHELDECSTAYRNNKPKRSNIDFAAEVINAIISYEEAYVLVGDFTHYFDKLDHKVLKDNLIRVLDSKRLSNDWYNVFRSITRYGFYEKEFLNKTFGTDKQLKMEKRKSYFDQISDFRKFQKNHHPKYNKEQKGITQGTAISAVFANTYAIGFDEKLKQISDCFSGVYRRYSDDFILIMPKNNIPDAFIAESIVNKIREIAGNYKIDIQEEKTELYLYENHKITKINETKRDRLDYLGFVFDGETVRMRGKSPYKFYRKAYQLIEMANFRKRKKSLAKLPYRKSIYNLYTDLKSKNEEEHYKNFISYAKTAQKKFDQLSPKTRNLMINQIKNRKRKIEKKLGIKIHSKV